ncbi:MAG: polysaccharide biosynthesis/export family protein [Polyangiaceae bacterium]
MGFSCGVGALAVVLLLAPGCASEGAYVWVTRLPPQYTSRPLEPAYVIRDGDLLNIRVFNQEAMSIRSKVRSDGRIALPAVGDVEARGKKPSELKTVIEAKLKDYINAPSVTVSVDEFQSIQVSVLGEVSKQGTLPLDPRATLAQVLASSGGLTDYASRDSIFVVRAGPPPLRVRFTYEDVSRGAPQCEGFVMQDGDLVVVE